MHIIFNALRLAEEASQVDAGKMIQPQNSETLARPLAPPPELPATVPPIAAVETPTDLEALVFGVVGITWEEISAGLKGSPHRRLAEQLKQQLTRVTFRNTGVKQALVYGDHVEDVEARQALRKKYRPHGRFAEFAFYNDAARAACEQFGIEVKILEKIEELPDRRVLLVQEPYFPAA